MAKDTNGKLKIWTILALAALTAVAGYGWLAKTVEANEERSKSTEIRVQTVERGMATMDAKLDMILKEVKE